MITHERDPFLGEIETEIVGMQYHKAGIEPGEQINVEREANNTHDRRAIRIENGHFEPVGYLPKKMAAWLAPLAVAGFEEEGGAEGEGVSHMRRRGNYE